MAALESPAPSRLSLALWRPPERLASQQKPRHNQLMSKGFSAVLLTFICALSGIAQDSELSSDFYEQKRPPNFEGIGKFYLGREISHVMGHLGADWLERDSRESEERPDVLVRMLDIQPGSVIADIGAGTGYFSRRLAKATGAEGVVLAVDLQPEMLTLLRDNMHEAGLENVVPILGDVDDPKLLGQSVDLALMVDVYHEFEFPHEMMSRIVDSLSDEGIVAFVEYRAEDPEVPIKRLHKMTEAQVIKEAEFVGLKHWRTLSTLPRQHVVLCRKASDSDSKQE